MEEDTVIKRVYMAQVAGSVGMGRPKLRWIYSVNAGIERRGVFIECL
jgi:hypothetical protein